MYDALEKEGADGIQEFNIRYETIVTETPFILFLLKKDTRIEIKKKISEKIITATKYGVKYLYIHALGRDIISNIGRVLEEIKKKTNISFEMISCKEAPKICFYKIILKPTLLPGGSK